MAQHTQTKWELDKAGMAVETTMDDGYVAVVADCGFSWRIPEFEHEANARIIAKAPEMLELLEKLIQTAQSGPVAIGILVGEAKSIIAEVEK